MLGRHASDHDGHVHSFPKVPIRSLGEDLENLKMQLVLNDEITVHSTYQYKNKFVCFNGTITSTNMIFMWS